MPLENQYRDKLIDERFARDLERIKEHEDHMKEQDLERKELRELSIKMGELLDRHDEKIGEHERRIDAIEQKPVKRWDMVVDKVITLIVAATVSYFTAQL